MNFVENSDVIVFYVIFIYNIDVYSVICML